VKVLRETYVLLQAALLWYNEFREDLEGQRFKFNPYDPCVVNDDFAKWLELTYGKHGRVKINRSNVHDYLGMKLDFSVNGKLKIDMRDYVKEMLESLPITLEKMM